LHFPPGNGIFKHDSKGGDTVSEKKTCEYRDRNYQCGRTAEYGEYCIFHSEDIEGKKEQFEDAFWKEFERQKEQEKVYDFKGFVFPGEISFIKLVFEKSVSFFGAQFSKKPIFLYAKFSEEAFFGTAKFSGVADFRYTQFSKEALFEGAKFSGDTSFHEVQFSIRTMFNETQFSGEADFGFAQFYEEVEFRGSLFSGIAHFVDAQFSKKAIFLDAEFTGKSNFSNVNFKDFTQCDMTNTSFYNVYGLLEYLVKNKQKIKHPRGLKYLHNECKPILGEATVSRLPLLSREIKDDIYLMSFKEKLPKLHFIWWLFADCGRSFLRWALWSILFALLFAFIYHNIFYLNDVESFNRANIHDTWPGLSLIYYSVVTFTTLGFGDITPKPGWLQFWVMLEVSLGYIMLGGLISILANKLARRS
jgi:uncharacterized protein YjbI with pentapeptide repeats